MDISDEQISDTSHCPTRVRVWDATRSCEIEAYEGESLMIALKRAGAGILAVCGGKGACGTCIVALTPTWASRVAPAGSRELRLLRHLSVNPDERLSCQIPLTSALDGLEVHVPNRKPKKGDTANERYGYG
jgi:ferredoxin, 2Fe-2S